MGRKPRFEYPGGIYHLIQRGNNREFIFEEKEDKEYLLELIKEYREIMEFKLYGYVIMGNHYHLIIRISETPLKDIMHRINNKFSRYYNRKNKRTGHVFENRYKGILVIDDKYLLSLLRYVHQNPVSAKICNNVKDYHWSSDKYYRENNVQGIVDIDFILNILSKDRVAAVKSYINFMDENKVEEASLLKGINIFGFDSLVEILEFLEDRRDYIPSQNIAAVDSHMDEYMLDFKEVQGQDGLIEYIVVAASGGHNMIMIGSPGCGKSMIAKRIPTILPSMTDEESLEVTKIYSVAGILREKGGLILERPFRAPHHNASTNSLIGGGNDATPGEISLAHNGVLFLDEIAEFSKKTLESLRQPMEDQKVTISRVRYTNTYPASFMLIAAMNPCPCGYYGNDKCKCSDYEVLKYRQKISGPIMDRMDIQKHVRPVNFMDLSDHSFGKTSKELRERVEFAREIQRKRFENIKGVNCNAQMNNSLVKEHCLLEGESQRLLQLAYDRFKYSARTFHKYLKVARTFADMEGADKIRKKDVASALMSRDLEKDRTIMTVL